MDATRRLNLEAPLVDSIAESETAPCIYGFRTTPETLYSKPVKMDQKQNDTQHGDRYLTAVVPKEGPALSLYIDKYRTLRLRALEDSPEGLSGSFEIERALPLSHFADLVTHPKRHIVVIIEWPGTDADEALIDGTWVGMAHIIGPIPLSEWTWPNLGGLRSDLEETRWSVFNGYMAPDHRAERSLLSRFEPILLDLCTKETRRLLASRAKAAGRRTLNIRQRACVTPKTKGLMRIYAQTGWRRAGFVTKEESLKAKDPGYKYGDEKETEADAQPDRIVIERVMMIGTNGTEGDVQIQSML